MRIEQLSDDVYLNFHVGRYDDALELVKKFHYSRRVPSNIQCVGTLSEYGGLFGDFGNVVAACIFCIPPSRWSEEVWELSRLVRDDAPRPLTMLISRTCKAAKAKGANLLVSFADKTHNHHGGIYQASSWRYGGERGRRMDGVVINNKFIPGRTCNNLYGTQSPEKLSNKLGVLVLPHFDSGKHLYWRALTKEGQRRAIKLGLKDLPYPKPQLKEPKPTPKQVDLF